jgi:NAD-dependent DNA ligase
MEMEQPLKKTIKIKRPKTVTIPKKLNSVNITRKNKTPTMATTFKSLTENPLPFLETQTTEQIASLLRKAAAEYYKGAPVITDDIFDIARNYLATRDPTNPALQEIGAAAPGDKVKLPFWMGSLDKIREDPAALEKWKTRFPGKVVVSDKLDGNSALLVYSADGRIHMYSRGDGFQGQDISHIIPFIQGVPKYADIPFTTFAVRGELIISKENWKTKGKGANARNAAAGVMHSKHPDKTLASIVEFVAYEQLAPRASEEEGLETMKGAGFTPVWHRVVKTTDLTMENLSKLLMARRAESPFEIDGIVIFHNAEHNQVAGKNPSYAFAFKSILTHEEAEVIVTEVEWNPSKDGYLKPLVHFPPVTLAGASIQKATGFNAQFIETNKIGPGSRLIIIRSGDVIPHIHKILSVAASGGPSLPDQSKMPWEWNATHVDAVLKDVGAAEEVVVKRMAYFADKLEMKGVGEGIMKRMYDGGIDSIPKMLKATEADLVRLEGFQAKSAAKVVKEIRDALARADCLTFMHASNLFGRTIGSTKLKVIITAFPRILEGAAGQPTEAQVAGISGIGPVTARQFLDSLPDFFAFMEEIGIPCRPSATRSVTVAAATKATPLNAKSLVGVSVVFTGVRDKDLEAQIEVRGGKVSTSVSGKTSVVVAKNPEDLTGKVKAAKDLGIPVVSLETFKTNYL